jgi:hypothetical protein
MQIHIIHTGIHVRSTKEINSYNNVPGIKDNKNPNPPKIKERRKKRAITRGMVGTAIHIIISYLGIIGSEHY